CRRPHEGYRRRRVRRIISHCQVRFTADSHNGNRALQPVAEPPHQCLLILEEFILLGTQSANAVKPIAGRQLIEVRDRKNIRLQRGHGLPSQQGRRKGQPTQFSGQVVTGKSVASSSASSLPSRASIMRDALSAIMSSTSPTSSSSRRCSRRWLVSSWT